VGAGSRPSRRSTRLRRRPSVRHRCRPRTGSRAVARRWSPYHAVPDCQRVDDVRHGLQHEPVSSRRSDFVPIPVSEPGRDRQADDFQLAVVHTLLQESHAQEVHSHRLARGQRCEFAPENVVEIAGADLERGTRCRCRRRRRAVIRQLREHRTRDRRQSFPHAAAQHAPTAHAAAISRRVHTLRAARSAPACRLTTWPSTRRPR
jgi:uncharacterized membrane protein